MKLPNIIIIDEKDLRIRKKSIDVTFPLSDEIKKNIQDIKDYLYMSQIDEYNQKYNLRAGMGLSFIQLGIPLRIFVIVFEEDDKSFSNYIVINPKIISASEELIYVGEGEGCLSVNRDVEGIVPRHARITIEGYDIDGKPFTFRAREELSVAFQHEMDHLDGILFFDKIDKKNPFKDKERMREL